MQLPLAPLNEQRRIVAKLDELLSKVDACKARLDKIPAILKRFRQSVLAAACSGRLTADWREPNDYGDAQFADERKEKAVEDLPNTWSNAKFSEFIESSFYGPRFSAGSYSNKGVPTIRTTDIGFDGSIILKDAPCLSLSEAELH